MLALAMLALACDETPGNQGGRDNLTACREYVVHVNDVFEACGEELPFDAETECPEILNAYAEDCTGWFDCLHDAYECDEEEMEVIADWSHCESCY